MRRLSTYTSFIKLEHTLFSLPLLFAGALLAQNDWPTIRVSLLIVLAAAGARVVALALNRIFDRHIDRGNPRTQSRHLSAGTMSVAEGWLLALGGVAVYLLSAWSLSDFCLRWSWIPLAGFTAYPFFKRFTKWAHVGLGIVWALVPLGGFFAVRPTLDGAAPAITLGVFCLFWLAGFDIIYATMDEEYDRAAGLYSLPAAWGTKRALAASGLFHALAFIALLVLYAVWLSGPLTLMLLSLVGILLYLEQKFSQYVDLAFFQFNVAIGFAVLLFVVAGIKGV